MTAKTSEILAQALDAVNLDELAIRARTDEYHDFLSPIHDMPEMALIELLAEAALGCPDAERRSRIMAIRSDVINGVHDASTEESDEWARSPDGIDAFSQLLKGH